MYISITKLNNRITDVSQISFVGGWMDGTPQHSNAILKTPEWIIFEKKNYWKKGWELGLTKTKCWKDEVHLLQCCFSEPRWRKNAQFRRYMANQWIKEEFLNVICVFSKLHRITNFLEGWHNKLTKLQKKKRPNLLKLSHFLKENYLFFLRSEQGS